MKTSMSPLPARKTARKRGVVAVEAAIVLPLVVLVVLGIMEYGRWLMTLHVFGNAARQGAAYAAKHTAPIVLDGATAGNATSDVTNIVSKNLAGRALGSQAVSVYLSDSLGNNLGTWTNAQAGQYICVEISGDYQFTVPALFYLPASMSTSFKAVKRSEGN